MMGWKGSEKSPVGQTLSGRYGPLVYPTYPPSRGLFSDGCARLVAAFECLQAFLGLGCEASLRVLSEHLPVLLLGRLCVALLL